jgi:hypothetical protein
MKGLGAVGKHPFLIAGVILVALFLTFVAIEWYGPIPHAGTDLGGKMTETQKTAITLIVDLAKLFMGWSLAIIGGAAYFLKANIEKGYPLSRPNLFLAEAVILASAVSIFFGHLTINFIVTTLVVEILNLSDPGLVAKIRGQYIAFLISLLFFGAYIHGTFYQRAKGSVLESIDAGVHDESEM